MITICGSIKNKEFILKFSEKLQEIGVKCFIPDMRIPKEEVDPCLEREFIYNHFAFIDKSNGILVLNPENRIGTSVLVEIGYCRGQKKPVYFLKATGISEIDCLADKISPTYEEIKKLFLKFN